MFVECAVATAVLGLAAAFHFRGTKHLRLTRARATFAHKPLPHTVRILHLSDFHSAWCVPLSFIERAIELGLSQSPDLICITGDFITWRFGKLPKYISLLKRLSAAAPTFACPGNHDGGKWARTHWGPANTNELRDMLEKAGIHPLFDESVRMCVRHAGVHLVGLNDLWEGNADPKRAFDGIHSHDGDPCILLMHNPDAKDHFGQYPWDLMLSGHTHGGQFDLPFVPNLHLPVRDRRYLAGLYSWNDRLIHITRGVGNVHGLRINCPPEVGIVELA